MIGVVGVCEPATFRPSNPIPASIPVASTYIPIEIIAWNAQDPIYESNSTTKCYYLFISYILQ